MSSSSSSYRVQYDLRPAKQVERRMIVDALQRLAAAQFSIADYQYTGFGSFYFVDFIMFHKLLGLNKLLSLEHDTSLSSRVEFNRPFKCVETKMVSAATEIPNLSRDRSHIVWLDYDGVLNLDFVSDIQSALTVLRPGSVLLVTVDVEPPEATDYVGVDLDFDTSKELLGPRHWRKYFEHHAGQFLDLGLTDDDFAKSKLQSQTMRILSRAFKRFILPRPGMEFIPLFNFVYRDSHWMLTMGGMIAGRPEKRQLRGSSIAEAPYYRGDFEQAPFEITVSGLTRKERMYLDREMPCSEDWVPEDFALDPEVLRRYREIYRFLPAFAELLL